MDPKTELIMSSFDIRKLNRSCNAHGCSKPVTKEVSILELDAKVSRKRELVSLYLCGEHFRDLDSFLERLSKACEKGKIILKEVSERGYVTY